MSREELRRRDAVRWMYESASGLRRGGFGLNAVATGVGTPGEARDARGITRTAVQRIAHAGLADHLASLFVLDPIKLQRVSGKFVFTKDGAHDGIDVEVGGRVEDNAFAINGRIDGFSPLAPARLTRVVAPHGAHLHPARAALHRTRCRGRSSRSTTTSGRRARAACSSRCTGRRPAPSRKSAARSRSSTAASCSTSSPTPSARRRGASRSAPTRRKAGTSSRSSTCAAWASPTARTARRAITIRGVIGPLTGDAGVNVRIEGPGVSSEPALTAAFPPEVREALRIFDPAGLGEQPVFEGGFVCDVIRAPGKNQKWNINTDVTLTNASGALTFFPYPLKQVRGKLLIRDGYVDIEKLSMNRGDGSLVVDGRVSWKDEAARNAAGRGGRERRPRKAAHADGRPPGSHGHRAQRPDRRRTARLIARRPPPVVAADRPRREARPRRPRLPQRRRRGRRHRAARHATLRR